MKHESLVWLGTQRTDRGDAVNLLAKVEETHYSVMTACLEKADLNALVHQWGQLQVANANQSVAMKRFIPQIDKAGHSELGDRLFQVTLQFMTSRIDKFTQSIEFRLERAEFCIACGRQLDLARNDLDDAEAIAGKELQSIRELRKRVET